MKTYENEFGDVLEYLMPNFEPMPTVQGINAGFTAHFGHPEDPTSYLAKCKLLAVSAA